MSPARTPRGAGGTEGRGVAGMLGIPPRFFLSLVKEGPSGQTVFGLGQKNPQTPAAKRASGRLIDP